MRMFLLAVLCSISSGLLFSQENVSSPLTQVPAEVQPEQQARVVRPSVAPSTAHRRSDKSKNYPCTYLNSPLRIAGLKYQAAKKRATLHQELIEVAGRMKADPNNPEHLAKESDLKAHLEDLYLLERVDFQLDKFFPRKAILKEISSPDSRAGGGGGADLIFIP